MNNTFIEFSTELKGYSFHSKKSGHQVFKYEMYWAGLSPLECFTKFNTKKIIHTVNY